MMFYFTKILFLPIVFTLIDCCSSTSSKNIYSIGIKGIFTCNGVPKDNVEIQLYDKSIIGKDKEIANGVSDPKGRFGIRANKKIILGNFEPYYVVIHNCENSNQLCKRKFSEKINKKYIENDFKAYNIYDAGVIELSTKRPKEEKYCNK
uniref:Transthyretin-like family-containing protein n=1 Tax=Strongyloides venezuelensis TaxID=75913 RepID=A0A0K0F8W9_STRVS